jgi:hypothetical protein
VYIYTIYITLSYRRTLYTEITHTNYLTSNSNIYIGKTSVPNFSTLSGYLFIDGKLYYNSGLSLNKSINPTSISL